MSCHQLMMKSFTRLLPPPLALFSVTTRLTYSHFQGPVYRIEVIADDEKDEEPAEGKLCHLEEHLPSLPT